MKYLGFYAKVYSTIAGNILCVANYVKIMTYLHYVLSAVILKANCSEFFLFHIMKQLH